MCSYSVERCLLVCVSYVFFFKQKTAYEMRISDWSSDVCSSDLLVSGKQSLRALDRPARARAQRMTVLSFVLASAAVAGLLRAGWPDIVVAGEIGRASCRERVCQYV